MYRITKLTQDVSKKLTHLQVLLMHAVVLVPNDGPEAVSFATAPTAVSSLMVIRVAGKK